MTVKLRHCLFPVTYPKRGGGGNPLFKITSHVDSGLRARERLRVLQRGNELFSDVKFFN